MLLNHQATISPKYSQTALSFSAIGANRLLSSASKDRLDWSQNGLKRPCHAPSRPTRAPMRVLLTSDSRRRPTSFDVDKGSRAHQ